MRNRVAGALVLGLLCWPVLLLATAQKGDILYLNGKKYYIHTNPLEVYFEKHPEKRPRSGVVSTANWRGYVATWEAKDDRFFLKDVTVERSVPNPEGRGFTVEPHSVMAELFPGEERVLASWYTGHVIVPDGRLVEYVHMGYASIYEKYILLRVEEGRVTRAWRVDRAGFERFRDQQFAEFKKTQEYREAFERATKEGSNLSPREREKFIREFYSERYMSLVFGRP